MIRASMFGDTALGMGILLCFELAEETAYKAKVAVFQSAHEKRIASTLQAQCK